MLALRLLLVWWFFFYSCISVAWFVVPATYMGMPVNAYIPNKPEDYAYIGTYNPVCSSVFIDGQLVAAYLFEGLPAAPQLPGSHFASSGYTASFGAVTPQVSQAGFLGGGVMPLIAGANTALLTPPAGRFQPDQFCRDNAFRGNCKYTPCKHLHLSKEDLGILVACPKQLNNEQHNEDRCWYRHFENEQLEVLRSERNDKPRAIIICLRQHSSEEEKSSCRYLHLPR